MKLGEYIAQYRIEHSLSQRRFALNCDLSNGYVSMLEKGINPSTQRPVTPTMQQLKKLAFGMGLTVAELLERVDDMPIDISVRDIEIPDGLSKAKLDLIEQIKALPEEKVQLLLQLARSLR